MLSANCCTTAYDNPDVNISQFISDQLGPRCQDVSVVMTTMVIYSLILLLGLVGNILTCVVIAKDSCMRTATNYYLFSLAVSDLCSLVLGLPFELYQAGTVEYPYLMPQLICQSRAFVSEMTSYASILTITAFSVERWLAICFPLKIQAFSKLSRATKIILAVWMIAMVCASPLAYFFQINRLTYEQYQEWSIERNMSNVTLESANVTLDMFIPYTEQCYLDKSRPDLHYVFINLSFWLFFVIPMGLLVVLYTTIGITIRRTELRQSQDTESHKHDINKTRSRKMIIRMLVGVVAVFFICWLPFHIQRMASIYLLEAYKEYVIVQQIIDKVFYISGYFYYSNSAINPILYNVLNRRFRQAFLRTICGCLRIKAGVRQSRYRNGRGRSTQKRYRHRPVVTAVEQGERTFRREQSSNTLSNSQFLDSDIISALGGSSATYSRKTSPFRPIDEEDKEDFSMVNSASQSEENPR